MSRIVLITLCFTLICPLGLLGQSPWQQYGKLEVSENGHFIQHLDGTPFLWIGDTGWGMFQQLTREEVDTYLDNRQKLGFNVIQSVVFWYPHGGGLNSGPHNAANAYGHRPFTGGEDAPDTSEPLLVKGGSPDSPNDYWDHVDYIIEAVRKRDMYLALLPCWGRAYITPQMGGDQQEFTEEEARSYGVFLGKRYQLESHIIWVLGGDAKAQIKGYDKNNNYQEWDKRAVFRAMAEGIAQGVTGQQPAWNQAHPAWNQVFMTYHPDGDPPDNSSRWFHEDAWLTANGVEVWKEVDQVYTTMLSDYQLNGPTKPTLFLEGSYEYGTYGHDCGWVTPVRVRRQIYHTFFAGGAGHTYGAGPIWAMRGDGGDYNCGYTWQQALDFPAGVNFAGLTREFLIAHQWSEWIPDQDLIERGAGEGEILKTAVHHDSDQMGLVYFPNSSCAQIKNTLKETATAHWFYPRDGEETQAGSFKQNEIRDMIPPEKWEDAILVLRVVPGSRSEDPVKIMPVGNSITAGEHYRFPALEERTGYRKALYAMLINSGYHVDFVGSQSHGIRSEDSPDWFDWNNEAYPGWKIPDISRMLKISLKIYQPDILLVHAGTNGSDWQDKPGQLMEMLDMVNDYSVENTHPMTVFLCSIINRFQGGDTLTTQFNREVKNRVDARMGDEIKIILVDMENGAGLDYSDRPPDPNADPPYEGGDMLGETYPGVDYDQYHPNEKGNTKMAKKLYEELIRILNQGVRLQ
ncbi:MAG: DUF4038 domain-containing protein [Bacteroidota bacterium]